MAHFTPLYIDGQQVPSSTNATFNVINPLSGEVGGISASASSEDCKAAVDSAAKAFETWEHTSFAERRAIFIKAAELVETDVYKKKVMEAMQAETGALEYWGIHNWAIASSRLLTAAGMVNELVGQSMPSAIPGGKVEIQRRAMGVILSIAPWNAPFTLTLRAIAVPIICGNTVVLKSSEYSPRVQAIAVELFYEAGLPKGVLNFVSLSREAAPALTAELIAHPKIRKLNFTGSDRVGRILATEAAKYLKPCVLELGGKAPVVVLDDADIEAAAKAIVSGSMLNSGQVCMSTERVIVQKGAGAALIPAIRDLCKALKAGDPNTDPSIRLGPLFTAGSAKNIVSMIRETVGEGAELLQGDLKSEGAIMQPHVLVRVKPGMKLWHQETFGPVVVIAQVDTIDEAVELANASEFSLSAALWTSNLYTASSVASRIRSGFVNINGMTIHGEPLADTRGLGGASGYGLFDVDSFTDQRVIVTHPLGRKYPLTG